MADDLILQFISAGDLPGTVRKRLTVPANSVALLVEGERLIGQRGPGDHYLGNWPRPAPDVILVTTAPFDLRPRIQQLKSGDGQAFDLGWPLTLQVQDPAGFHAAWLAHAPGPADALDGLADHLAGLLHDTAQGQTVAFTFDDLSADEQVQGATARELRAALLPLLKPLGLVLVGSQRPEPRTLADEQATLDAMNQAMRAVRDARFEALFERLEDKQMLADRLAEWSAGQGAAPPDPAVVDLLWQVVDQGPEEAAVRAQQAAQAVEREVAALRLTVQSERTENERRFRQMMARLTKAEKVAGAVAGEDKPLDPARMLRRLLIILRLVGTTLTLTAALIALLLPQLTTEHERFETATLVTTIVIGVLTIISDLWLRRRVRQVRHEANEQKRTESRASLNRRREADRLVRARLETGLKQVADNLEATWKKGYGEGGAARDLAVSLREAAQKAARFGEQEVRAANYYAGQYLSQQHIPDNQLAAVLDLDDDLLARSQSLAQTSQTLYEQVNTGQVDAARAGLRELENGLNALRNRYTERGAYLLNPM